MNSFGIMIFSLIASIIWHICNIIIFKVHISSNYDHNWWMMNLLESLGPQLLSNIVASTSFQFFRPRLIPMDVNRWFAPPQESCKVNFDRPLLNDNVGIGVIVRDWHYACYKHYFLLTGFVDPVEGLRLLLYMRVYLEILKLVYLLFGFKLTPL